MMTSLIDTYAARFDGNYLGNRHSMTLREQDPDELTGEAMKADELENDRERPADRVGSPFATDPAPIAPASSVPDSKEIEQIYDVGSIRYTALGAVAASVMVVMFGSIAAWWFPSGGTLIAALGCALSLFGMTSTFRKTSLSLLAVHMTIFVVSYGRSIA